MGSTYRSGGADITPNTSLKGALGSQGGVTLVSATSTMVVVNFTGLGNVTFEGAGLFTGSSAIGWTTLTNISGFSSQITDLGGVAAGNSSYGAIYDLVMGINSQTYVNADTGNQADADLVGNADNNALFGSGGRNYFEGGGGADQMVGGGSNDTFRLYYGDFVANESISGGQGIDTIEVKLNTNPGSTADVDLSTGFIGGIEVLRYLGTIQSNVLIGNHVTISAEQALANNNGQSLAVWFDGAQDSLTINGIGSLANPDFSNMAFTNYSAAADTITFTAATATGPGGGGLGVVKTTIENDIVDLANVTGLGLNTWTGDDTIIVRGTTLVTLGLDGGTGTDILKLENATLDFAAQGSITGMEGILFDTGTSTVTFSAAQVTAGVVPAITGSANVDTVVIAGAITIDASTLVLNSWTEGVDTLKLTDIANNTGTSFIGSSHRDTIFGNNGADTLNGKGGADALFGGTQADKFVFDSVALTDAQSGTIDTVKDYDQGNGSYDFSEGDQIDLSALLSTAYNHGSGQPVASLVRAIEDVSGTFAKLQIDTDGAANGVTWTTVARLDGLHPGNSLSIILDSSQPAGATIAITAPSTIAKTSDFNGDGFSDILFRNNSTGDTGYTDIHNGGFHSLGGSPVAYGIVGTGDYNGDGFSDLLFRDNSTGDTGYTDVHNGGFHSLGGSPVNYRIVGSGDYNGDGFSDLLFRDNATGDTGYTDVHNGGFHSLGGSPIAYSIVGSGDYNGDNFSDLLFRNNSTGDTGYTDIHNGGFHSLGSSPVNYSIVGSGDYNGDHFSDLLFRDNATGDTGYTDVHNGGFHSLGGSPVAYSIVASGDYNADGFSDLLFRDNSTGDAGYTDIHNGGFHSLGGSSAAYLVIA